MNRRSFILTGACTSVAGCQFNRDFSFAEDLQTLATTQSIYVATLRQPDPAPVAYGMARSEVLDFLHLSVSIPPAHVTGNIEWPRGQRADPDRDFALASVDTLADLETFSTEVRTAVRRSGTEAMLFVHGFNTSFAKGIYRHAQIAWDYELRGPQVSFSWPSAGHPFAYNHDRDSVLHARDDLSSLLISLLRQPGMRLSLVGHSMGCLLIMEALRQIALTENRNALRRLSSVSLVAPDIDIDLFRAQLEVIRPLPHPFVVAVAQNDRFLRLSSRLTRGLPRLGALENPDAFRDHGATVLDLTALGARGGNHFLPGTSQTAIALIRGLNDADVAAAHAMALGPDGIERAPRLARETIFSDIEGVALR